MPQPIVYVDQSAIREGKFDHVKAAIGDLVAFIESNVPRALSYGIYLDERGSRMTVVQIHPDSASLEFHMEVGAPAFAKFRDLIRLSSIDVYGAPSDRLLAQLHEKARKLGDGTVAVHTLEAGFTRIAAR